MNEPSDSDAQYKTDPIDEIEEARALYYDHFWTVEEIAVKFGITKQGMHHRLKKAGFTIRRRGRRTFHVDPDVLRELYVNKEITLERIAKRFNRSATFIKHELVHFGIPIRTLKRDRVYDRETIEDLYVTQGLTVREAAKKLNVLPEKITRELRRHGITHRHIRRWKVQADPETVRRLYLDDELSLRTIGKQLGISYSTVGNLLRRQGIDPSKYQHRRYHKNK